MVNRFLLSVIIYFSFVSISLSKVTIECKNFIGSQVVETNGKITNVDDGYVGQIIRIQLPKKNTNAKPSVEWQGPRNNFKVDLQPGFTSKGEGWVNFFQYHKEVFRTYTYFWKKSQMTLVETEAQLITGLPKLKVFIGDCSMSS